MREDLSRIIASLINDVAASSITKPVCKGLDVLKENWPGLTQVEKEEIAAIALSLEKIEEEYNKL